MARRYVDVLSNLLYADDASLLEDILSEEDVSFGEKERKVRTSPTIPRRRKKRSSERVGKLIKRPVQKKKAAGLYLAHSSANKPFARRLAGDLRRRGIRVWLDDWEIRVGDSIIQKIEEGISGRSHLAVVLSPEAVKSKWVKRELNAGLMKELQEKRVIVLPILFKDCKIPPLLREKRYADFRENYASGVKELVNALRTTKSTRSSAGRAKRPGRIHGDG